MKTYSRSFWLACLSMFFFMTSFNVILPELNEFITKLGGADHKGLIITFFTISAAISRPFSGKLADYIGRRQVMYVGVFIAFLVCLLYPLSTSIFFFLFLRFLHGFSAGFAPTGATALITDLLPSEKRGAGMGVWGTFISLGIGTGQSISFLIVKLFGIDGLFLFASSLCTISIAIIFYVQETLSSKEKFHRKHLSVTLKDVFEPAVLPSAIVMFFSATSSGIIFVLSADISTYLGIANKGWFFMFYVLSTIILRLFTARLSDVIGRRQTLAIGMFVLIISMYLIGSATSIVSYTIGSIIFGLATGVSSPTLFAWTADLSHVNRRGVGAGTMFIALELGIMFGSFGTTFLYDNSKNTVFQTFAFGMTFAIIALIYLLWHLKTKESKF